MQTLLTQPTTILITGATSGIGAELLSILRRDGHRVIAVSRTASALSAQEGLTCYDCDLANPKAVEKIAAELATQHPDIRIIINNAALQLPARLDDPTITTDLLVSEVSINLLAPAIISRAFLPTFKTLSEPSAIVNISSGLAFFPKTTTALYCATKAGLHSFSQSLRYQYKGSHIHVIEAILPMVDTPMTKGRGSGKLPATVVAHAIIESIRRGHDEIYVGKAKLLRILNVLAPFIARKILKSS
jgi:uncharacterized oxidoreductase